MPRITARTYFNGAEARISRLGLDPVWAELEEVLTGFELLVAERRDANGAAAVRRILDKRFESVGGWSKKTSGGVDWTKSKVVNGTRLCIGVEVQFSARSDLLIVDVSHLRDQLTEGAIDVGVIAVPSDNLASYLTDRVARYSDAVKAVERARATDLPLAVVALEHDGSGEPLVKRRTRQGRALE